VLPYEAADGPANMALDAALLDQVAESHTCSLMRTYGWTVPTLSLGYFQHLAQALADARWRTVPLVRRATGGGAIWHEHELTYALVLSAGHSLARPGTRLYGVVHAAIAEVLRERGLCVERRGKGEPAADKHADARAPRPFLCFSDHDPEDIVCGEFKVVGSAQRKRAGATLQHGSILLRGANRTPEHRGVCDFRPLPSDPVSWSGPIAERIALALGLAVEPRDPPPELRSRGREIERIVYRQDSWTGRR
jgi:lipoate-protein ligase A